MDAQNAVEPASTKPFASPKRPGSDSDQPKSSAVSKAASGAKPDPSQRDARSGAPESSLANDEDGAADGPSDAETIVLPGKDGHSPSKVRKIIKHEANSDGEDASSVPLGSRKHSNGRQDRDRDHDKADRGRSEKPEKAVSAAGNNGASDRAPSLGAKRKKTTATTSTTDKPKTKDGSSGLSSAPASPPQRRRRSSNAHSKSDSETAPVESPRASTKDSKHKSLDRLVPHKRKAPRAESEDEAESRKARRQRTSGSGLDASRKHAHTSKSHHEPHSSNRNRSVSPPPRPHRRSISTQLLPGQSANGLSHKKKRVPAPLQSTDYHSDESSVSGSPHPRSSKLRSLTTPATAESTTSPMKMAPHKKHLDAHGQTFLARACAKGEYETAKTRLQERPSDINVADYAGNTPLQIAALNGYDDIVKLLVDAGCNLECVNNDKDTPLLDAVENGHLEVVKILLAAGVNPRKANAFGEEPIERLNEDDENADAIRRALQDAKQRMGIRQRTSEDHQLDHTDARSSHGPESPRRSPGAAGSIHAASGRRAGTVRSTKTSNHLLYMPMDDKTLRAAAARGDEETVTRILQVRDTFDDPESMVAAARGGHDIVMQLLLALGSANPDPAPISNNDYSTPMLAAIGQENLKVIRLLLDQNNFDPMRRYKGETYYELAKRRRGPNWIEEEQMLKNAYDGYKKSHKEGSKKNQSPVRREQDRESRRTRTEPKDEPSKAHKRKASSPTREPKKAGPAKASTSPKEKRRSNSFNAQHPEEQISPRRGPGRPKKDDRIPTIAISEREASPATKPIAKAKRTESDIAAASSEGEAVKPRRKLVSRRELKGERDKNRRASMTSNASSLKEPSSPREETEKSDKPQKTERYHDRTKALKRDESRDRLPVSGETSSKRHRPSATPPHASTEKDSTEGPVKRRRLDVEGQERRLKPTSSDERHLKPTTPRDSSSTAASGLRVGSRSRDSEDRRPIPKLKKVEAPSDHGRRESGKSVSSESSIHVKSEEPDVDMPDADPPPKDAAEPRRKEMDQEKKMQTEAEAREVRRKEEERKRKEEEDKEKEKEKEKERLRLVEEATRRAEEEAKENKRRAEAAEARRREEEETKRKEEEERKMKEEEERKQREQREQEERKQREEEERKRQEEEKKRLEEEMARKEAEERKRKEEEERRKREEEKKRKEEEERKKREEEERLRREQLEREAAEQARREREEEERREQERKERALKEEMERRRVAREAREAEQRKIRLEQERIRLAKLPPLLRWLDGSPNPKLPDIAEKFSIMQGVRYDCIIHEANGTPDGREQWLLNTQLALLLGEKDLQLSRYTAWTKIPVSLVAKRIIWRLESDRYALTTPSLYELGKQLPGYYGREDPERMSYRVIERLRADAWEKFAAMDMFFVKASDFMYIIPTIQHLQNVRLTIAYRELPENESQLIKSTPAQKWKNDPDANRFYGFAPSNKHFINGDLISEDTPGLCAVSTSPFPEKRVPRRGLVAVTPDDPDYHRLCKDQGLEYLLGDAHSPLLPNGVHSSPTSASSHMMATSVNGLGSPALITPATTNGGGSRHGHDNQPISPSSESGPAQGRPLANGVHETVNGSAE